MMMMNLTKRADMWVGEGSPLATEVFGYEIDGLPTGQSAYLRHRNLKGWQLLASVDGAKLLDRGHFETPDMAMAALERILRM